MPPDINRNEPEPRLEYIYRMPLPIEDSDEEEEPVPQPARAGSRNRNRNRNRNQNRNAAQNNGNRTPHIPAMIRDFIAPRLRQFLENRRASRRENSAAQAATAQQPTTSAAGAGPLTSRTGESTFGAGNSGAAPSTTALAQPRGSAAGNGRTSRRN